MALLGSSFPEDFRKKQFKAGAVIFTHCHFTKPPKNKYHVICCCDPLLVLLINSDIPDFIRSNDELNRCQVELDKKSHPFLNWDSYLNGIDAHNAYDISFFNNEFDKNFDKFYRGNLSINCIRDVLQAVNSSKIMIPVYKKLITKELNKLLIDN
ncbi:hypothetical protein [Gilliamella apicola]|uniref:hypothetical protein n=1 Tax=Gilliamella apicola TaxID=1196095 RepID=UPI000A00A75B|nr:hypothetical protein [Gilliamella apicola]ORF49686.1 hypothetical protein B5799_03970 [Gilliamella apicola]ORF61436.1 hypothetical protein B5804_04095 [Gilliamella apicola]ORF62605.1 hypothetical protein B5801_01885 [Gilliamella apicola]